MSWTTNKVSSNDKNRKIDWFKLKKIVIGTVRRDQFLYTSHKFDYKFGSWLLQCFSFDFSIPFFLESSFSILYYLPLSSPPSPCRLDCRCWFLFHQHLPKVFRWKLLFRYPFLINAARELVVEHLMRW